VLSGTAEAETVLVVVAAGAPLPDTRRVEAVIDDVGVPGTVNEVPEDF
jgi:hypothetical protein